MASLLALGFGGYYLLITKPVQDLIGKRILAELSARTDTEITAGHVSFKRFEKLVIDDFFVQDQNNDTLLYVKVFVAELDSLKLNDHYFKAKSIEVVEPIINISQDQDSLFNFQFFLDSLRNPNLPDSLKWKIDLAGLNIYDATICLDLLGSENQCLNNFTFESTISEKEFDISHFSLLLDNGFYLQKAAATLQFQEDAVVLPSITALTPHSAVIFKDVSATSVTGKFRGAPLDSLVFSLQSNNSMIGGDDISLFFLDSLVIDRDVVLDGFVEGSMAHLRGRDFRLMMDSILDVSCSFDLNNIAGGRELEFSLNLQNINVDIVEAGLFYNGLKLGDPIDIAEYAHWKELNYKGSISGIPSNFNTNGELKTPFGTLNADIFITQKTDSTLEYNGDVSTRYFRLGHALKNTELYGSASANLFVSGATQANNEFRNFFSGEVSSLTLKGYRYRNVFLDGSIDKGYFDGRLRVNDPNLKFDFNGEIDYASVVPVFDFSLDLKYVDLVDLKLIEGYEKLELKFDALTHLKGSKLEELNGSLDIKSIQLETEHGNINTGDVHCLFKPLDALPSITLASDYLRGNLLGFFDFTAIPGYINHSLAQHYEDLPQRFEYDTSGVKNDFTYRLELENIKVIASVLDLPVRSNGFTTIGGSLNSLENTYQLYVNTPYVLTHKQLLDSVSLNIMNDDEQMTTQLAISEFAFAGDHVMQNLKLQSNLSRDTMDFSTVWDNASEELYSGDFDARIWLQPYGRDVQTVVEVQPSDFYVSNVLWQLNKHELRVLPKHVDVDSLVLSNGVSHFYMDGVMSDEMDDTLNLNLDELHLSNLSKFLNIKNFSFDGQLTGEAQFLSFLKKPVFVTDLEIAEMSMNQSHWGDLQVSSEWLSAANDIVLDLMCANDVDTTLGITGLYHLDLDSLDLDANLNKFSIEFLRPYLEKTLEEVTGDASGHLDVRGPLSFPKLYGALGLENSGFRIDYISADFGVEDTIYFDRNRFVFKEAKVTDQDGNPAYVTGDVKHNRYKKMETDIIIETDRFLGLNTSMIENEYFYGDMYIAGVITVVGTKTETIIGSRARIMPGSDLTVPLAPVSTASTNNFISYVEHKEVKAYDDELPRLEPVKTTRVRPLIIDMNFDLTPDAAVKLDFGAQSGDIIEAVGSGNLNLQFQHGQPFNMFGEYNIEKGKYLFTLQQIINKTFDIEPGSSLRWSGRPGNAIVDIDAIYNMRASLYNLMPDAIGESNKNRRVPVNVELMMENRLSQPDISFDIKLPNTDEQTQQSVSSIIETEEEISRQVLSLLIVNSFYTPEYYTDAPSTSTTNDQLSSVAAVTVSEFLSNQLANWMSQISDNVDLGFRYIPEQELAGQGLTPQEYEMAISTQFFNDRVTFSGNVGYQDYADEARPPNTNSNFVGEVDVEVKLTEKISLNAYSHQNDDILYENNSMKQGAGITYQEEFTSVKELGGRYKKRLGEIFKGKEKKNAEAIIREEEETLDEDLDVEE